MARRPRDVTDAELDGLRAPRGAQGPVARRGEGRPNVFRARVRREELVARRLRDTAQQLCDGSLTPILTQLVSAGRLSPEGRREARRLVGRLSREGWGGG